VRLGTFASGRAQCSVNTQAPAAGVMRRASQPPVKQQRGVLLRILAERSASCLSSGTNANTCPSVLPDCRSDCVVIFTTTRDGEDALFEDHIDAHPLLSRCVQIPLTNQGLAGAFAERARQVADAEGLNGKPLAAYKRLVQRCRNNMRAVLQAVESGEIVE